MKLQAKSTLRMTVIPQPHENSNVNGAICGVPANSPLPIPPAIAEEKVDPSLSNDMIIDDTEQQDVIKRAILHKLDEADEDKNFWFSDPERIRKLTRGVENDFNMNKDDLLRNDLRELLLCTMNEFFRNRKTT